MRLADWDGSPQVPDGWPGVVPVSDGDTDADGDGVPDTVVAVRDGGGAWVFTDTDADGFADQVIDLAPSAPDDPDHSDDPVDPDDAGTSALDVLVRLVTGRTS